MMHISASEVRTAMSEIATSVRRVEEALAGPKATSRERARVRRAISESLQELAGLNADPTLSISATLETILVDRPSKSNRELAAITIRLMSCPDVFPATDLDMSRRHIVRVIENCPELALATNSNAQTHQRLESYKTLHSAACERLHRLLRSFTSLHDLSGHRQQIMKVLNHGPTKNYLGAFGFGVALSSVSSLLKQVDGVIESQGHELQQRTQSLIESIAHEIAQYQITPTFIARDYMCPFLQHLQTIAKTSQEKLAAQFACTIEPPPNPYEPEKKYALHVPHSDIRVFVPMSNSGPGLALDVRAHYLTDTGYSEAHFGDLNPGPFMLELNVNIDESRERLDLEVEVHWRTVDDPSERTVEFSVAVTGQRTDIDWNGLSLQEPYSLEVAYDHEFYGRKDALRRLLRSLAPNRMQSCYITGQKRVGKSSLAHAVAAKLQGGSVPGNFRVLFLECGEFRDASGEGTLRALGSRLEEFLCECMPSTVEWKRGDYTSSLAHLNKLLAHLLELDPSVRFVAILDEFDEINESLYRYGELANTFFLNLRTLSSKRNMAFVLVGAERMPYVMTSQGEKLNKFRQESLNSFDLATEWPDYQDLVRKPVASAITFHDAAVQALYEVTDGHPFFTKVLCSKIFELAVETRDGEVSGAEVGKAVDRVVRRLDTNAFAHYWRDGIRGGAEEVEIVSLDRCRLLVAWARVRRAGNAATAEAMARSGASPSGIGGAINPLVEDLL